jgi:hypothetical protein
MRSSSIITASFNAVQCMTLLFTMSTAADTPVKENDQRHLRDEGSSALETISGVLGPEAGVPDWWGRPPLTTRGPPWFDGSWRCTTSRRSGRESSAGESNVSYPNFDVVDQLVHGAFASHGYVVFGPSGKEVVDEDSVKDAVFQLLVNEHVVDDQNKLSESAITAHELYEAIFPNGPGARQQPANLEELEARKVLSRKLWGYTNTGVSGYCQKRSEAESFTYVLCEGMVGRTYRSQETGRPKPSTEVGRFFTDDPELINMYSTLPSTAKLTKAAEAVSKHMQMAVRRHPELAPAIARQVGTAVTQAKAALAPVADARSASSIGAAKSGDDLA